MIDKNETKHKNDEGFSVSLKWYFFPNIITLITGPMFLVLAYCGIVFTWQIIATISAAIKSSGFSGLTLISYPIISMVNWAIVWSVFHKIPKIWKVREKSKNSRIFSISILFLGSIILVSILDFMRSYFMGLSL
jgi:hypothetical protein